MSERIHHHNIEQESLTSRGEIAVRALHSILGKIVNVRRSMQKHHDYNQLPERITNPLGSISRRAGMGGHVSASNYPNSPSAADIFMLTDEEFKQVQAYINKYGKDSLD